VGKMKECKMNLKSLTLRHLFEKYSENRITVFIIPKFDLEDSVQKIADKLNLDVESVIGSDLFVKDFNNIYDAQKYVMSFRGEWLNYFTVECFNNGQFITENT
jgi:purine-nucleoside phosphorylase